MAQRTLADFENVTVDATPVTTDSADNPLAAVDWNETDPAVITDVDTDDLQEVERGDVILVDGTKYPVFRLNSGLRSLFTPNHPEIILPDGSVDGLAFGPLSEGDDGTAVAIASDTHEDMTADECLATSLDPVVIYKSDDGADAILSELLQTDQRECPECGDDVGTYQFGDRNGRRCREARRCGECETHYVIDRKIPESTATVTARNRHGEWGETVELSGIYREVITSRFRMDPRRRATESYLSAEEVAEFIDGKLSDEGEAEQFGYAIVTDRSRGPTVTWYDHWAEQKMEVKFRPVR